MTNQAGKLNLNWMQTTGSALAALSSAVVLSTLGATGTLVGAAVGSIVVTVGGTVYSHYLSVSRQRMAAARSAVVMRASSGRDLSSRSAPTRDSMTAVTRTLAQSPERFPLLAASAKGTATTHIPTPDISTPDISTPDISTLGTSTPRLIDGNLPGTPSSWRDTLRGLRWKPALAASLGVFVLVMGAIVSMELATGRALSSFTGGSSADGPRTSIALLGSTSDAGGGDSTTTDPAGSGSGSGSGSGAGSGAQSTGGADSGSTAGSDTGNPRPDTSTPGPEASTPTEPAPEPTPGTPTEPAPEPSPAPSTQAPAEVPAPTAGAAVSGAVADSLS